MFDKPKIILLILLCIFCSYSATGQSPYFKSVSLTKNHNSVTVSCIFQDSRGYMWFSTSQGLIRYDGVESYIYGTPDSIGESPVTAISEDSIHRIWIGHKDGTIEFLYNNYFNKFRPEEGLGHSEITFIKFDFRGILWFGTLGEGIYYYKGKNRKRIYNINMDDGLNDNYVYTFAEAGNGNIYTGTDNGINILNQNTGKVTGVITMKNGLPDNIVKHLEIAGNTLWIGMDEKGICTFDINNHKFNALQDWNSGTLNNFSLRTEKECWISTKDNGILKVVSKNGKLFLVKQYSSLNGLPSDYTQTIFSDRESNIWGSCKEGIFFVADGAFEFINQKSEGFDFGSVFSFVVDKNGNYWAATQFGLVCSTKDAGGKFHYKKILSKLEKVQNAFISLYQDSKGYIWAGTYGYGVFRINPENQSFTKYDVDNGLSDNNILSITGKGNDVWLATAGGGAIKFCLENSAFTIYNIKSGMGSNYLYSVFPDDKGNIWFSLDGKGASVLLKSGKLLNDFIPDSLGVNSVYAIAEDLYGELWFLTSDKGLLKFDGRKFRFINETNGLKSNNVRSIISDKSGNIIIASNEGIQVYFSQAGGFETFGDERGVAYLEPNLNGISLDSSGNIWISDSRGVLRYSPPEADQQSIKPLISIGKKLLFFNTFDKNKHRFSYNQNHFTFEYAGIWFQSSENLIYRYKLENYDFDWSRPANSRSVTYSNLPPGNYVFRVEVSYKPGQWIGSKDAIFAFKIRPPFYKTWWFIGLSILIVLASIYYYIKARTAKLLKAKDELEAEVKKRTSTILQQNEEIRAQRDEIEAQRNYVIEQRDRIAQQNAHITSSIQYASKIQQAVLSTEEELESQLLDYFVLNRPMDIVSGDFYWLHAKNNYTYVIVADCTGHGVPGALMGILGISLLNKIINNTDNINPADILDNLRNEVKYQLRQTGKYGETQDGMDIAVLIFDKKTLKYQFAGANNPLFIIRNRELTVVSPDRMPIGIYPLEKPFEIKSGTFQPGDMIYLFSDGYSDQLNGTTMKKFRQKNFKELLTNISDIDVQAQKNKLNQVIEEWKAGDKQNDDILILGFRISSKQ